MTLTAPTHDGRPIYGGSFFWINGTGSFPIPNDAFYMSGAGGQNTSSSRLIRWWL